MSPTSALIGCQIGRPGVMALALLLIGLSGCSPEWYTADADRETNAILEKFSERTLAGREAWVRQPQPLEEEPAEGVGDEDLAPTDGSMGPGDGGTEEQPAEPVDMHIDLDEALKLAFTSSREFQNQKESLYLQGLGYSLTRFNFGPVLNSAISAVWSDSEFGNDTVTLNGSIGVSQILPTGGSLSVSNNLSTLRNDLTNDGDPDWNSSVGLNLRQPLLRGAGYEVSHEALTQGERSMVYAVRSFELFREDFSIRIAQGYYELVSQKKQLQNDERNYESAVRDFEKTKALKDVDRARDEDVFNAQRRMFDAEDQLLVARTNYELAVDDFKILLGLPTSIRLTLEEIEPEFTAVRIDPDSAVEVALFNRLDLQTERDQLEDSERSLRIARNSLLPDLDLTASQNFSGDGTTFADSLPEDWSSSVGINFNPPVNQKSERNSYRSALISHERAVRDFERRLDEIERDILNRLRELDQFESRIDLQEQQITYEERAVEVYELRYESGDIEARELSDARQSLNNARNQLIRLKVQHFISSLELRRDLGILFIDQEGMWLP